MTECSTSRRVCQAGADYVRPFLQESPRRIAIISCEGACVKGEVARVAANLVCYRHARDRTVRICLGDALTASSGFDQLVSQAPRVVAIEGCALRCGSRMLQQRFPAIEAETLVATRSYTYDEAMFEIFDMPPEETMLHAQAVASTALQFIKDEEGQSEKPGCETACSA